MTDADDRLERLFREPIAAAPDLAFAARVAVEVAKARRVRRIYGILMSLAAILAMAGLGLAGQSLAAPLSEALGALLRVGGDTGLIGLEAGIGLATAAAIFGGRWIVRQSA